MKTLSPDLSIIIVTFNNSKEITRCLRSVSAACNGIVTEVIIIDNDSQDNTVAIIEDNMASVDRERFRIRLTANPHNRGFAKACNQGLKTCRGNYILLLNPDTEVLPATISRLIKFLQEHPEAGVVAPQLVFVDGRIQPSCRRFPTHRDLYFGIFGLSRLFSKSHIFNRWKMGDFDHESLAEVDQPQGACIMTNRRVLEDVGLLDEQFDMFFNDVDWCRRCKQRGWKIFFYPKAKVMHYKGASVYRKRPEMILSSHRAFYFYLRKYYHLSRHELLNLVAGLLLIITGIIRATYYTCK